MELRAQAKIAGNYCYKYLNWLFSTSIYEIGYLSFHAQLFFFIIQCSTLEEDMKLLQALILHYRR